MFLLALFVAGTSWTGCSSKKKVPMPVPSKKSSPPKTNPSSLDSLEGIASWYGHPYHGRRTAGGEVYDMYKLTAAHNTLPFDSTVLVENLDNHKTVFVRINDRGPFVGGRIIDLSLTAARRIDMVGPGTARVRLVLSPAHSIPKGQSPRYTLQVGFFTEKENARRLKEQLDRKYREVSMTSVSDGGFRIQVGRQNTRREAEEVRAQMEKEGIRGFVGLLD